MPIEVLSKTFSDEFNTGTTTDLVNSNVSDIWTATVNIQYSNIIDAGVGEKNAEFVWKAYSSADIARTIYSGKQVFEPNQALLDFYKPNISELRKGFFIGATFDVTGFSVAINGTYIIKDIIKGIHSTGKSAIVCEEVFAGKKSAGSGRFAVTEALTSGSIDYRASGTTSDADYSPTIEINGLQPSNYSSATAALDASSATVVTIPFSYNGAYQTGSLTISGVSFASDIQKFELIHTFRAIPISIYNDASSTTPLPDDFSQGTGIGYYNLYDSLGGYSSMKGGFSDKVAGGLNVPFNVPYANAQTNFRTFNNKYIGGSSNYSVSSLVIVRTSDSADTAGLPLVEEKFTVTFNVLNTVDTPFSDTNTKVKVGIENLPEIITNLEDYEQQYLSDYGLEVLGAAAGTGNASTDALSISAYTATFTSTSQIAISFDVDFTANAQTQIDLNSEPYFSIYVETQDHLLDYTNSDRTVLSVFSGVGLQKLLIDPITVNYTKFLTSPYTLIADGKVAADVANFPVQNLISYTEFSADWTSRPDLRINRVTQSLVLVNSSTLEEIEVEKTAIPVKTFNLINSEYPDCSYSVEKGFKIPSTELRNLVELSNVSDVSSVRTFKALFPFFIRWESYTELLMTSVPSTILDSAEAFDGKNYDLYRYDQLTNWSLVNRIKIKCSEGATDFTQTFDYTLPTSTYDAHPEVSARSIKTYDLDGTTLKPTIVASGLQTIDSELNTVLEVVNTLSPQPNTINDFEYEFYLEGFENGSPTKIQRISSINNLLSGSWFKDNGAADGLILKTINGSGNPVGTCLIDVDNLVQYDKYRVYSTYYTTTIILTWTFQTNFNSPTNGTFDPSLTVINGELPTWTLTGGTTYTEVIAVNQTNRTTTATLASGELDGTTQDVEVTFSTNLLSNITGVNVYNDKIVGALDLSLFTSSTYFYFALNTGITSITNPTSTALITTYQAFNCGIVGDLDLSGLTNLGGSFSASNNGVLMTSITNPTSDKVFTAYTADRNTGLTSLNLSGLTKLGGNFNVYNCSNLTSITNPTSSQAFTVYSCLGCDITGTLDLSGLTGLGGAISLYSNSLMTSITNPTSSQVITSYVASSCNLTGTLDLSGLTGLGGGFNVGPNSLLTAITNPTSSQTFTTYSFLSCEVAGIDISSLSSWASSLVFNGAGNNLSVTDVNNILIHLDGQGLTTAVITLNSQTSTATPTGAGATSKAQLITDGCTVVTD